MNFPKDKIIPRYTYIAVFLLLLGFAILFKAGYIMTVKKDYWMKVSERFQKENQSLRPKRGDILADNGEVLAASIPEYKMYFDFMTSEKDSAKAARDQYRRDSQLFATEKLNLTEADSLRMGKEAFLELKKHPPLIQPLTPNERLDSICDGLHEIFPDIDPAKMRAHLLEGRKKNRMNWPVSPRRITYVEYRRVKQLPVFRLSPYTGGFHVDRIETRKNPYGRLAARTIGDLFKGKDSARSGLELSFDSILRGKPGRYHRQKVLNKYLSIVDQPAQDGYNVQTTINVKMQDICETALRDKLKELQADGNGHVNFGVCILMEVATGDIKAISSLTQLADGSFMEIQNKAVSNLMEPGSVFKPMSFLVAFNDGYIHLNDPVYVGGGVVEMHGRKMKDHNWRSGGYGMIDVRQSIQKSSNVGVSYFIDKFYASQPQKFVDGIYATGVAEDLHIPIPGYARPVIRGPREKGERWAKTDLPWMSIGYVTQIPPISTLTFYNGIANNGRMMQPRFVKAILNGDEVVKSFDPVVVREHMASENAVRDIQTCLREVVTLGVGKKAGSKLFAVAGKTGTAQVWTKAGRTAEYLVSFAGYFPFEQPKYSMIVCINKSGVASGGLHCGPVFKRVAEMVMALDRSADYSSARDTLNISSPTVTDGNLKAAQRVLSQLRVKTDNKSVPAKHEVVWGTTRTAANSVELNRSASPGNIVPDVSNYGARDALFRLEQLGLKVKLTGTGRVVAQSLKPGHQFKKGESITLTLSTDRKKKRQDEPPREAAGTETAETPAPSPHDD